MVEDPESDDERTLVLVVPRKAGLEPKQWEGEAERNECSATVCFYMGDVGDGELDGRHLGVTELSEWLVREQIGIRKMTVEVPVLDPVVIESIGGLDT